MGKQKAKTNLRRLLDERGLTAASIAKKARVSERSVQGIAQGMRKPSLESAKRIAKALGMEPTDLF